MHGERAISVLLPSHHGSTAELEVFSLFECFTDFHCLTALLCPFCRLEIGGFTAIHSLRCPQCFDYVIPWARVISPTLRNPQHHNFAWNLPGPLRRSFKTWDCLYNKLVCSQAGVWNIHCFPQRYILCQHSIVLVVVPQICWFLPSGLKAYMQSICCVHSLACCSSQQLGCGVLRSWDGRSRVIYLHQSVSATCTAVCCSYFYPGLFHRVHYHRCSSHRLLLYNPALLLSKLSVLCSSCPFPLSVCLTLWMEHTLFRTKSPNEIVLAHGLPILDTVFFYHPNLFQSWLEEFKGSTNIFVVMMSDHVQHFVPARVNCYWQAVVFFPSYTGRLIIR